MYKIGLTIHRPIEAENKYRNYLFDLVDKIFLLIKDEIFNNSKFIESYKKYIKLDDFNNDFEKAIKVIQTKISIELSKFLKQLVKTANFTKKITQKNVEKSLKKIIKVPETLNSKVIKDELRMWVSQNVRLIKTIPEKMLAQVEDLVYKAARTEVSYKQLSKELQEFFSISKKRADIIARDQINKLNGNLIRAEHLELGIKEYIWSTAKDGRVRESHRVLDGKICSWNDNSIYKNNEEGKILKRSSIKGTISYPSEEVLCRCDARAVFKR